MASIVPVASTTDVTRIAVKVVAALPIDPSARDVANLIDATSAFFVAVIRDTVSSQQFALYEQLGLLEDAFIVTKVVIGSQTLKGSFRASLLGVLGGMLLAGPIETGTSTSIPGKALAELVRIVLDAPYHAGAAVAAEAGERIEQAMRRYAEPQPRVSEHGYRITQCTVDGDCVSIEMTPNRWNPKEKGDFKF